MGGGTSRDIDSKLLRHHDSTLNSFAYDDTHKDVNKCSLHNIPQSASTDLSEDEDECQEAKNIRAGSREDFHITGSSSASTSETCG